MDKPYKELDKQINARINPDLHRQLKEVSQTRDIILSTLIEKLLDIGLKHYLEGDTAVDTSRYLTKENLIPIEDRLKKLESLIANSGSSQAIATDKTALSPEQKERVLNEVKNVSNLATAHIVGTELAVKEMLEYTKANPNTKNPKRDIERGLKAYPDEVWEPIARGFWKRIS